MSTELDQAREIAERIARRVSNDSAARLTNVQAKPEISAELAAVRAGLTELQKKMAQLEAKVSSGVTDPATVPSGFSFGAVSQPVDTPNQQRSVPLTHSPWLAGVNAGMSHPSREKFGVEEAVVSELVDYFEKEKTCSLEPGGKPCDHCDMCSSRGF